MTFVPPSQRVVWTRAEDALLREHYPKGGIAAASAAIPWRTATAIFRRARKLRLYRRRRWTPADDRVLRRMWETDRLSAIARTLDRTEQAVFQRAWELGMSRGIPRGHEYLNTAARRTGFAREQLAKILRWAGVAMHLTESHPSMKRSSHYRYVDTYDVDEAIARWMRTENVTAAARSRRLCEDTLRRWLLEAGHTPPKLRRGQQKPHWRLDGDVIDRVVAARAELETVGEASLRLEISRQVLARWLREAGCVGDARTFRLRREDIDRVVAEHRARPTCRVRRAA